jgi:hypothetical protein
MTFWNYIHHNDVTGISKKLGASAEWAKFEYLKAYATIIAIDSEKETLKGNGIGCQIWLNLSKWNKFTEKE